jgi:hypothetical protein
MILNWKAAACALALVLSVANGGTHGEPWPAQEPVKPASQEDHKTKLEAFQAKYGVVIVRGFSAVGSQDGMLGTSVEVECKEFTDASSGKKEYGITVAVKGSGRLDRKSTSYIDYDEIDSLLKGIEYISKIDKTATKLSSFQADYKTKGDLGVSTYNNEDKIQAAVQSGRIGSTTAFMTLDHLIAFRNLIARAKEILDGIK